LERGEFKNLKEQWIGAISKEVIPHFPPQLIIGKQLEDDREVYADDKHEIVKVQIFELDCEYAYSAPTGLFNLQVPHVEARSLYN
jgi:hypothetical protein